MLLRFAKLVDWDSGMEEPNNSAPAASFDADHCGKMSLSSAHVVLQDKVLPPVNKPASSNGKALTPMEAEYHQSNILQGFPLSRVQPASLSSKAILPLGMRTFSWTV